MTQAVRIQPPSNAFEQDGRAVYRWALTHGATHARRAIELAELDVADIDVLVTHQANLRIIEPLAEQLGMTSRVVVTDVVESGNTSAASIPLGFSKWWHDGRIPPSAGAAVRVRRRLRVRVDRRADAGDPVTLPKMCSPGRLSLKVLAVAAGVDQSRAPWGRW